jgi:membrane-associated protease RseP (regulator of RpoE activity)
MKHPFRVIGIFAFTAVVVFALWAARARSARQADRAFIKDTIHSAITNPLEFAKTHFTGGIGAILAPNPVSGVPVINGVGVGSPAEKAGLHKGDIIIKVNGETTSGRTLAQNLESIRGFAAGSVTLTVQRNGPTNLQFVIRRNSWKRLRGLSYNSNE